MIWPSPSAQFYLFGRRNYKRALKGPLTSRLSQSMNILKILSIVLSVVGLLFGLVSAYWWHAAGKVTVSPAWELEIRGDINKNIMGWVTGNMIAVKRSGDLNKCAALWTAATILVSTLASVLSTLA
jgi:fructose-specific phosphotransferase system IIC component